LWHLFYIQLPEKLCIEKIYLVHGQELQFLWYSQSDSIKSLCVPEKIPYGSLHANSQHVKHHIKLPHKYLKMETLLSGEQNNTFEDCESSPIMTQTSKNIEIPYIRIFLKKVNDEAYLTVKNLQFLTLSQSLDAATKTYKTDRCYWNKYQNFGAHEFAEARLRDQHRRFQVLLVRTDYLTNLISRNPAINPDFQSFFDKLHQYSEWKFEITLIELSLISRSLNHPSIAGQIAYMKNSNGLKVKLQYEIQLVMTGEGLKWLKMKYGMTASMEIF